MLEIEELIVVGSKDNSIYIVKINYEHNNYVLKNIFYKNYNSNIMLHSCLMQENTLYMLDSYNNLLIKYDMTKDEYFECYTGKDPRHFCKFGDSIYVTNFESDSISIIDDNSCCLTGTLSVSSKPHDIIANKLNNKLYVACYEENEILEYDIAKSEKKHLELAEKPMHLILYNNYLYAMAYKVNGNTSSEINIINLDNSVVEKKYHIDEMTNNFTYDAETKTIYILAIESGTVYSIDLINEQIKKQIHLNGYLENVFVSNKHLYITNSSRNNITIIDKSASEQLKNIALNFSPMYISKL